MGVYALKKIKIAQIGTSGNSHGNKIWQCMKKQSDIFEIVGYAFPEGEREKFPDKAAEFDGYKEMTVEEILSNPEIEAVTVETEEIYLTKYALMAAKAGKHIHMEKPGGTDLALFEELIETVKNKSLTFSIGYMYRFNPKINEVFEKVKNGELGEIYSVEAHMDCKHHRNVRRFLEAFPGGMLFFLGCHLIDLIYRIQGQPLEVLPLSCSTHDEGIEANDYGMVAFKYKNGVSFAKTCANECGGFLRRQLVVCGTKGTIEINPLEICIPEGQYSVMKETKFSEWADEEGISDVESLRRYYYLWDIDGETSQSPIYDRYEDMMESFAERVRGKKEEVYTYDYELNLYKLLLKSCGKEI